MKPHLATDWREGRQRFPVMAQPKIDGVRGLHLTKELGFTGRSLKKHANKFTTEYFSDPAYLGFDGEIAAAADTDSELCRTTTSALNTIEGEPYTLWHIFDYIDDGYVDKPYFERYMRAKQLVLNMQVLGKFDRLRIVPYKMCENMEELLALEEKVLNAGYEGLILRDPNGMYKSGRSTIKEGSLLRVKRFVEEEIVVTYIEEGQTNNNEATINETGNTERSTHQENMVPNGMVGAIYGTTIKDIKDPISGKILFNKGTEIKVAPGKMKHEDRIFYFNNPDVLIGEVVKFKFFAKGIKDKVRFPTYQSHRGGADK